MESKSDLIGKRGAIDCARYSSIGATATQISRKPSRSFFCIPYDWSCDRSFPQDMKFCQRGRFRRLEYASPSVPAHARQVLFKENIRMEFVYLLHDYHLIISSNGVVFNLHLPSEIPGRVQYTDHQREAAIDFVERLRPTKRL